MPYVITASWRARPGEGENVERLLREVLAAKLGKQRKTGEVLAYDLMTYDTQPAARTGAEGEFVQAPRLDNLASCHAGIRALLDVAAASAADRIAATRAVVLYDH